MRKYMLRGAPRARSISDMNNALTETQFAAAQDKIDAAIRAAKRGTPERAAAEAQGAEWETAIALPQATAQQRTARRAEIAAVAAHLGLVSL